MFRIGRTKKATQKILIGMSSHVAELLSFNEFYFSIVYIRTKGGDRNKE